MVRSARRSERAASDEKRREILPFCMCVRELARSLFSDIVSTPCQQPLRAVKWSMPLVWCFCNFCFQSVMLHQATMEYVLEHTKDVLPDVGHNLLGEKDVPMKVLDMISFTAMSSFFVGAALLRDLRLWVKVFMSCGFLFFTKGLLDYLTALPDSSGWASCQKRLGKAGVEYFQSLENVTGQAYWSKVLSLEVHGLPGTWPVRYCSDMILSGHTFVMFLFLLGCTDLVRKAGVLMTQDLKGLRAKRCVMVVEIAMNVLSVCGVAADLYLIVVNHFHYTVDVVLAIIMTLLFYTNAGLAVLTDWWIRVGEEDDIRVHSSDHGSVWIPPHLIPCCGFSGFYSVVLRTPETVAKYTRQNLPEQAQEDVSSDSAEAPLSSTEEEDSDSSDGMD